MYMYFKVISIKSVNIVKVKLSQQLCNELFLLPNITVSSFSFFCPLLQYFNIVSDHTYMNHFIKQKHANVQFGSGHVHGALACHQS